MNSISIFINPFQRDALLNFISHLISCQSIQIPDSSMTLLINTSKSISRRQTSKEKISSLFISLYLSLSLSRSLPLSLSIFLHYLSLFPCFYKRLRWARQVYISVSASCNHTITHVSLSGSSHLHS